MSPEGVFTPSPVTFVGALVFGAADFRVAVCARRNAAVSERTIAIAMTNLVIQIPPAIFRLSSLNGSRNAEEAVLTKFLLCSSPRSSRAFLCELCGQKLFTAKFAKESPRHEECRRMVSGER